MLRNLQCERGHLVRVEAANKEKLARKASKKLIVCPFCKPENIPLKVLDSLSSKLYICPEQHLTSIYPFDNGYCNVICGALDENIEMLPQEMENAIKSGKFTCRLNCNKPISPISDEPLTVPTIHAIKTRTYVGDIWDKNKCPTPRDTVEHDGGLEPTEFAKLNRKRLKKMRKKTDRNTKPAGKIL
jgi:hypothetical protein